VADAFLNNKFVALAKVLIQRHPTKSSKRRLKRRGTAGGRRRLVDEDSDSDGAMSARSHRRKYQHVPDDRCVAVSTIVFHSLKLKFHFYASCRDVTSRDVSCRAHIHHASRQLLSFSSVNFRLVSD